MNSTKPPTNSRRAPIRSAIDPAVRMHAANVIVYALTTHCRPLTPPPRSAPIDLIATLTIDTSSWTTAKPRLVATSVQRRLSTLDPVAGCPSRSTSTSSR